MLETLTDKLFQLEIAHVNQYYLYSKKQGHTGTAAALYIELQRLTESYHRICLNGYKFKVTEEGVEREHGLGH